MTKNKTGKNRSGSSDTKPYKVGNKIRVLMATSDRDHSVTFGRVLEVSKDNVPTIKYEDYSGLKISNFDRCVKDNEVIKIGEFKNHIWKY